MVSLNWPWPPELNGLSMTDAVNATQNYVNQVEVHMVGLDLNTTECGVVIGFMLSALADATRILDFTHRQSGTSSDLRNQIEKFGAAMQSLTQYMENIGVRSDKSRSNTAPAAMDVDTVDQGDASDTFVKAEFSDSSVEAPSGAPNQNGSSVNSPEARAVIIKVRLDGPAKSALMDLGNERLRIHVLKDMQD